MAALHQINGVLLLDKPKGLSSNHALQQVRRLFGKAKGGYAGTLDPLASGLLPISMGEATKFINYFSDASKSYDAIIKLGFSSTTGDAEGELSEAKMTFFDSRDLENVTHKFMGRIEQIPPMYSAIKVEGEPLYKLARQGKVIPRENRSITIESLRLEKMDDNTVGLSVSCSKGTYIRVLAEDIAGCLGTKGYLTSLRRTGLAGIAVKEALSFEQIEDISLDLRHKLLKNIDFSLNHLPRLSLIKDEEQRFMNGMALPVVSQTCARGNTVVHTHDGIFAGLAFVDNFGELKPKRLMSQEYVVNIRRSKSLTN
jgi:tRNA pseudouridine55 synthase